MARLKKQKWWLLLNGVAIIIFIIVLTQGSTEFEDTDTFDTLLACGKWGIRFLLLSLAMTPLNSYFGWRGAIRLRKPAGLWAFGFTAVHLFLYFSEYKLSMLVWPIQQSFLLLGILGFVILLAMALTSNKWAMRRLKKGWKRLHRLVYLAGISVTVHAVMATNASKRIAVRDPDVRPELIFYLILLLILLAVRLPMVRRMIKGFGEKRPYQSANAE